MKRIVVAAAIGIGVVSGVAEVYQLEEIVVTGTRVERKLSEAPGSLSVVTGKELEASGARNVGESLDAVTGGDTGQQGTLGQQQDLSLRGMSSAGTLVLLDGVPVNGAYNGLVDLSAIPLDNVERIEVLRGPASSLYGANATGGVVNVITRPRAERSQIGLETTYGTFNTWTSRVFGESAMPLEQGDLSFLASVSRQRTDGGRLNSDSDMTGLGSTLGWQRTGLKMKLNGGYEYKVNGAPGSVTAPTPLDRQRDLRAYGNLSAQWDLSDQTVLRLSGYAARSRLDFLWDSGGLMQETLSQETNKETEIQVIIREQKNTLVLGARYRQDDLDQSDIGLKGNWTRSGYVQDSVTILDAWTATASMRYDDLSAFGENLSPMVSLLWKVHDRLELKGTAGTGFRAPTFSDLYWRSMLGWGKPDLKPERSTSYEAGFIANAGPAVTLSGTYFKNEINDFIQWAPEGSLWIPSNIRVLLFGWENELAVRPWEGVKVYANHTWLNAKNLVLDQDLMYRSRNRVNGGVIFESGPMSLSVDSEYHDNRLTEYNPLTECFEILPPVIISKARVGYQVTSNAELYLAVDNIEDVKYELRKSYPMPGRSVMGGVRLTF